MIRELGLTPSSPATPPVRPARSRRPPTPPRPRSRRRWPPRSTASRCCATTSRTRTTTRPASSSCPATTTRRRGATGPSSPLHLQRPQPAGRALQGAGWLRDQRRQHDQAGELHGRRRLHRHPVPRRGRRPSRRPEACAMRWRSWSSSRPRSRCWGSTRPTPSGRVESGGLPPQPTAAPGSTPGATGGWRQALRRNWRRATGLRPIPLSYAASRRATARGSPETRRTPPVGASREPTPASTGGGGRPGLEWPGVARAALHRRRRPPALALRRE